MFQIIFIAGAACGGYVVHRVHSTLNKKPLKKLKNKMEEAKDNLKEKWTSFVEKRETDQDQK